MTTKVELTLPSGDIKKLDGVHKLFPKLAKLISLRQWAYLYGPSASFKSTSAKLAAQSLELSFGCITLNPMTFPSALFGYMDANGNYVRTPFRDAYEFGGVFLIDEMDNASGQVLTLLNPALGNGHCPFADGLVTMHPNFVCIATGNTAGRGGSKNHAERRMFDAATTRRFVFLEWDYDWTLVRAMTLAMCDKAGGWCDYIKKLDAYLRVNHPHVLATPQSSFDGAKLMQDDFFTVSEIAYMTIWKGLDHDTVAKIVAANPLPQIEGMRA